VEKAIQINLPKLLLLKFLLLAYHHSHFLAATLDFTSFFTMAFLGAAMLCYNWAVFGLDSKFPKDFDMAILSKVTLIMLAKPIRLCFYLPSQIDSVSTCIL